MYVHVDISTVYVTESSLEKGPHLTKMCFEIYALKVPTDL